MIEEEVESKELDFVVFYRRIELDTEDEEDIIVRYLIARTENYYENIVLTNLGHNA